MCGFVSVCVFMCAVCSEAKTAGTARRIRTSIFIVVVLIVRACVCVCTMHGIENMRLCEW